MATTRRINYSTRYGKHIERRVIFDALLRLDRLAPLGSYAYVGLGGIFFSDHLLAHRLLGINELVSIEAQTNQLAKARFANNRPLSAIQIKHGTSTDKLPTAVDWSAPSITWLDYDGQISRDTLEDAYGVASSAAAYSVLILTFNVEPAHTKVEGERPAALRKQVGSDRVPLKIKLNAQLGGWLLAELTRAMTLERIEEGLDDRNAPLNPSEHMTFTQLFHFHHEDGAKMLTLGVIFHLAGDPSVATAFSKTEHVNKSDKAIYIRTPVFTPREVLHMTAQLPGVTPTCPGVVKTDVEAFEAFYRWYPTFRDVEL